MKLYIPIILLIVLCLLITGCTFIKPTKPTAKPGGDEGSESSEDSGTKKTEWTKDIPLTGSWTAEKKLSEIPLVPLCEDTVPLRINLTGEKDSAGSDDNLETRTSYAEIDPYSTVTGTFMGLAEEIERFNTRAKARSAQELKEAEVRHKSYQGLFSKESIYLVSDISMRIDRADTKIFSYIEEIYRYNRGNEPDFYEVHGHTIDPMTGQELSLNDFFTSVETLPGLIFERTGNGIPYGTELDKEKILSLLKEAIEGCRDDGSFAWAIHPAAIEFDIVMETEDGHYLEKVWIPFAVLKDCVREEAVFVGYDYLESLRSSDLALAVGVSVPLQEDGSEYKRYYLGQKNGNQYIYAVCETRTDAFAVTDGGTEKIGYVMGEFYGGINVDRFAENPDPEHIPLDCDLEFEQSLGLTGEARITDDGSPVLNGLLKVRGVAQPIMTAKEFEAEIFPDEESTKAEMGIVESSSDLYIRRTDGETFVDAVIDGGPQMCRLYITGSAEEGWMINGYPKDEVVGYEGFPER
ncbi:MAG: hypothetical protein J5589_03165 [Firmicutes bacterium]|nr:hypothetical protein [Bacillota bacterium]